MSKMNFLEMIVSQQQQKKHAGQIERTKGNELFSQGDWEGAIEQYTRAIATYPVDAAAYSNRAWAKFKLGRYEEVVFDADKALEMDPSFVKAYHRRGKANMMLQRYEAALHDFEKCNEQSRNDPDILTCIAEACDKIEELKMAAEEGIAAPTNDATDVKPRESEDTEVRDKASKADEKPEEIIRDSNDAQKPDKVIEHNEREEQRDVKDYARADNPLRDILGGIGSAAQQRRQRKKKLEQSDSSQKVKEATEKQKEIEKQMAELDARREKLMRDAEEAARIVKMLEGEQKSAELEATEA